MNSIEKSVSLKERFAGVDVASYNKEDVVKTKLAVFDFDETLVHSKHVFRQVNNMAMEMLGLPHDDYIVATIYSLYKKQYIGWGKNLEEQQEIYHSKFNPLVSSLSADPRFYKQMEFYLDMKDVIKQLAKTNIALAVASSRDLKSILRFLDYEGVRDHFEMIQATEGGLIFDDKPSTQVVDWISTEVGISTDNAVMIGDSSCDVQMGKNAGMKTIGIGYGSFTSAEKIALEEPDYLLKDEKEIKNLPAVISKLLSNER